MLVSRASKLAITVLVALAAHHPNHWVSANELSKTIEADLPFLRQIMNRLAREGIVRSKKGQGGGFQIAVSPDKLSLAKVVQAIEGSDFSSRCLLSSEACNGTVPCPLAATWHPIRKILLDFLNCETIQTVAERCTERIDQFDIDVLDESYCRDQRFPKGVVLARETYFTSSTPNPQVC